MSEPAPRCHATDRAFRVVGLPRSGGLRRGQLRGAVSCPGGPVRSRAGPGTQRRRSRRILDMMKPTHAATRRFLPTSPFKPPPAAPPAEQFAVQDQVTHDKYGLGRVMSVEDDTALVIDFGTDQVRITTPCAKLTKL
jgi:hypothetical protein